MLIQSPIEGLTIKCLINNGWMRIGGELLGKNCPWPENSVVFLRKYGRHNLEIVTTEYRIVITTSKMTLLGKQRFIMRLNLILTFFFLSFICCIELLHNTSLNRTYEDKQNRTGSMGYFVYEKVNIIFSVAFSSCFEIYL